MSYVMLQSLCLETQFKQLQTRSLKKFNNVKIMMAIVLKKEQVTVFFHFNLFAMYITPIVSTQESSTRIRILKRLFHSSELTRDK